MTSTTRSAFVTSPSGRLAPSNHVQHHLAEEGAAPDPDRQDAGEDHNRVDALPARPGPVDVLEVDPERELVKSQRRADAIRHRSDAREKAGAGAGFDQPDVSDDQEQEDAPHQVVNVQSAARDVVKRADPGSDHVGDPAHDRERDEKSDRGQEQPLPALVLEVENVAPLERAQPARDLLSRALRASSSSSMAKSVRGSAWMCPWKASVQCSGGHLRT